MTDRAAAAAAAAPGPAVVNGTGGLPSSPAAGKAALISGSLDFLTLTGRSGGDLERLLESRESRLRYLRVACVPND